MRLATEVVVSGTAQYPHAGELSISLRGAIGAPGQRLYQVYYRDPSAACTGAGFNLTNGVRVDWQP